MVYYHLTQTRTCETYVLNLKKSFVTNEINASDFTLIIKILSWLQITTWNDNNKKILQKICHFVVFSFIGHERLFFTRNKCVRYFSALIF